MRRLANGKNTPDGETAEIAGARFNDNFDVGVFGHDQIASFQCIRCAWGRNHQGISIRLQRVNAKPYFGQKWWKIGVSCGA